MSKSANSLQEFLQNPNDFTIAFLLSKNITDADCVKLANALKDNKTITHLYLQSNKIGDAGAAAIGEGIKGMVFCSFSTSKITR